MSDDKPREFWILEYPGLGTKMRNWGVEHEPKPYEAMCRNGALINFYHVVTKDAYDDLAKENERLNVIRETQTHNLNWLNEEYKKLQAENEELTIAFQSLQSGMEIDKLQSRCSRLESALDVAVEALEAIAAEGMNPEYLLLGDGQKEVLINDLTIAREAIAKIRELLGADNNENKGAGE